jgi:hypothetical protein
MLDRMAENVGAVRTSQINTFRMRFCRSWPERSSSFESRGLRGLALRRMLTVDGRRGRGSTVERLLCSECPIAGVIRTRERGACTS